MKDILTKVGRNDGMTVPDGYFESAAIRLSCSHVHGHLVYDENV